ncbi:MAG: hypothetical protein WC679_13530 [Bacteroidales bacterium]|jgi:hypothetical protein
MNLITPQLKDAILQDLINSDEIQIEYSEYAPKYSISENNLNMILRQFDSKSLVKITSYKGGCIVRVTANAHDYILHGGFVAQEEILKANIEKLGLELELLSKELEPKLLDKAEKIASLAHNILTALRLFS